MKPGANRYVSCSSLQLAFWYKAFFSKKEKQRSTREDSGETRSDSKESESVALWLALETENSALHYICTRWSYLQTTTVKRAAHVPVLDMGIPFRRSGALWRTTWFTQNRKAMKR